MKLMIIRHGEPDYENDTLTEKGWKEAEMLAEQLIKVPAEHYYVSPLGRARDTASCTLNKLRKTAVECDWLQEFTGRVHARVLNHLKNILPQADEAALIKILK